MAMRPPVGAPTLTRRTRILLVVAAILVLLLLGGARLINFYVDWLWFGEVGYRDVFTTVLFTRIVQFLVGGLLIGGLVALSLWIAYRSRPVFVPVTGPEDPIARYRTLIIGRLRLFAIGIPVVIGVIAGFAAQGDWQTVQQFVNSTPFGVTDPEFGIDVGFYAFELPFYRYVLDWLFIAVAVSFGVALITHYIFGGIRLTGRAGQVSAAARAELAVLAGLFVLLKAVAYYLDRYELLYSDRSELFTGATYTDLNAVMPAKLILLFISIICAAAFFVAVFRRNLQLPAIATVLLVLSSVLVGAAWPQVLQQFVVAPNANERESIPIERNIAATRQAFGLTDDKVTEVPFTGTSQVSPSEVRNDTATVPNIRLLDPAKLGETFTQLQQRRQFYGFPAKLDIDRYSVGGKTEDYIVAARELNSNGLAGNQTDWINRRLVYTHGNGLVVAPANRVNASLDDTGGQGGLPVFTSIDTATAQSTSIPEELRVAEPRIYYGELIDGYSIVGAEEGAAPREYDSDTQSYTYHGKGGVPLGNIVNRLVFSLLYGERNILFNNSINDNSKIMYVRDPGERVQAVAPWLTPDSDPYPAVVDGRITWIVDGYTTLQHYPYAQNMSLGQATTDALQPLQRPELDRDVSYLRNSVKATVDAYDGTVTLYAFDETDPVLQTWMKTFPGTRAAGVGDQPDPARALPVPGGPVQGPARAADPLPRGQPAGVLRQRLVLGRAVRPDGAGRRGRRSAATAVLRARRATGRGGREHAVVPADQRPGVPEPADPVGLRVGQLRSGQLRQDHRAAAATGHPDPRPTAGADPAGRLAGGQRRAGAAVPRRAEHGQLRQPADAAGGRRAALRGTGLHRAGQPGVQLSTAGPGAGVLQRPGGLRPEPVRGAGRGVRAGRGRRCDTDARRRWRLAAGGRLARRGQPGAGRGDGRAAGRAGAGAQRPAVG